MTEKNKSDINDELDELALHILDLMNDYIECKVNTERLIKNGCLDFAKSRYIMGNNTVSALQFPTDDITAQATVESSTNENIITYNLKRVSEEVKKDTSEKCTDSDKNKVASQNPLRWFGLLVPPSLRQGQAAFYKVVDVSVQCANVATEINSCESEYKRLLKKKETIENDTVLKT